MNYKVIMHSTSNILLLQAFFILPSMGIAVFDGDTHVLQAFIFTELIILASALLLRLLFKKDRQTFFAREGFLLVGIAWIVMSAFGALPFFLSGEIPGYVDAWFETVSGFTTTGSSILTDVEAMSRSLLFWRSFTHWLGGMGILVFMLAVGPAQKGKGESLHVLRAESSGPAIDKIVPKIRQQAAILYGIYFAFTIICFLFLFLGGMPLFDSICITFGTAGTGGFGIKNDSMGSYSAYLQIVVTVFMAIFGVSFNIYFMLLMKKFKAALKDEELRVYLGIMVVSIVLITINIYNSFASVGEALRHASFTVSSIMTSSGYATTNYDLWPQFSRSIITVLMLIGASAGSTGGGIKVIRVIILVKSGYRELRRLLHPRSVMLVRLNKQVLSESTIRAVNIYMTAYLILFVLSFLIISLDNFSFETNITAVISSLSNIGPGFGAIGPAGNFSGFSVLSKLVLSLDMLLGRLEIFPLLLLLHYRTWSRSS